MTRVSHAIDRIDVTFDDPNLVANAGLLLVATLTQRLGLEALVNATLRLFGRVGGFRPGRKVLTLVHAMIAGGTHIEGAGLDHVPSGNFHANSAWLQCTVLAHNLIRPAA